MCIGVWSTEHPSYALILAANRDEFLSRPTTDANFHSFEQGASHGDDILSGIDIQAGGTWLGVNKKSGRLAFLTNITEPYASYDVSRGQLVTDFLQPSDSSPGSHSIQQEIDALTSSDAKYAGFNLLVFTPISSEVLSYDATLLTNNGGGNSINARPITLTERRCGAISNGVDLHGGNEWPKVRHGVEGLNEILTQDTELDDMNLAESLIELLSKRTWPSPPNNRFELRNTVHVDPLVVSPNQMKTSALEMGNWDPNNLYGTRLSTVVLIRRDGEVVFLERDMWTLDNHSKLPIRADPSAQRLYRFKLEVS